MQPSTALIIAVVTGGLAVGIVAADLVWNLEATVETRSKNGWTVLAESGSGHNEYAYRPSPTSCAFPGDEIRITFDNNKPLPDTVEFQVRYFNESEGSEVHLIEDTWHLDAFEVRRTTFVVPEDAAARPDDQKNDFYLQGSIMVEWDRSPEGYYERAVSVCIEEAK